MLVRYEGDLMQKTVVFFHDLPDQENPGKTIRESNLAIQHTIPLGTLVEFSYTNRMPEGVVTRTLGRLFVVAHDRDCDGTPLYSLDEYSIPLGRWKNLHPDPKCERILRKGLLTGFPEISLKVVPPEKTEEEPDWEDLWEKSKE